MKPWQRPDGWYEVSIYPFGKRQRVLGRTADYAMRNAVRAFQRSFTPEQSDAAKASEPQEAQAGQKVSLAQFVRQWLESISEDVELKTAQGYRQMLEAHVLPFVIEPEGCSLGSLLLGEVRVRHIRQLIQAKKKEQYAKNTIRLMRGALSSALTDAVMDELIVANPAMMVSNRKRGQGLRARQAEIENSVKVLDGSQYESFCRAALRERRVFGILFYFLAKTGLRPSEAIPLLVTDLDLETGVVRVRKAWASGRVRPCTKTGYSRVVDLSRELVAVLRIYLAALREAGLHLGRKVELLFPSEAWSIIDWNNAVDAFHRICGKAKVQGIVPPKDLRHTYASLLLSRYAPMGYVQEQLGHANMSTTLKYYHQYIQVPRGARYQAMLARLQEVMATGRHCDLLDFGESEPVSSANGFGPGTNLVVEGRFSTQTVTGTVTEPGEEVFRENSRTPLSSLESSGEPCRNRTYNLLIKSQQTKHFPAPFWNHPKRHFRPSKTAQIA